MVWIGGGLFYLLVLSPAGRELGAEVRASIDKRFQEVVQLATLALIATGAVITFDRLQLEPGPAYVVTLAVKVAIAIWMFVLAQGLASRGRRRLIERRGGVASLPARRAAPSWLIVALGLVVLLLSDVLKVIGPAS